MKKIIILILLFSTNLFLYSQNNEARIWKKFKGEITDPNIPLLPDYSYAGYKLGNEAIPTSNTLKVFDVTNYGAIANDNRSDQSAIQSAINAAESNGGGVVFFPPGEFLVNTNSNNTPIIKISKSNIVLKGSGSTPCGATVINMKNHMLKPSGGNNWDTPPMFVFSAPESSSESTNITQNSTRGDFTIKVQNARIFENKKYIKLEMAANKSANKDFLESKTPRDRWSKIVNDGVKLDEVHEIESVNTSNNTITLKDPIVDNIKSNYGWKARTITLIEGCGFEDIHFKANFLEKFSHHKNYIHDYGWHALAMKYVAHSWVRRCKFSNITGVITFRTAYASTINSILIDGNRGHSTTIANFGSTRILQGLIWDNTGSGQWHGADVSAGACGSVIWRVQGSKRGWDSHASQPRTNLIDLYESSGLASAAGSYRNYPNHLNGLTLWNQKRSGSSISNLDFWDDCGGNYCGPAVVNPIVVGIHGANTSFKKSNIKYEESNGRKASPESLYEAQLKNRVGNAPWLNDIKSEYSELKNDWNNKDSEKPKVSFFLPNSPNQGSQTINEGESIQLEAITSNGIKSVALFINGTLLRQEKFAPFEWGHFDDIDSELKNLEVGVYNLKLVANNCDNSKAESEIVITVRETLSTTDHELINNLKVYPNPVTNNTLFIDLTNENINDTTLQIALYNLQGKLVQKTTSQNINTKMAFKINEDVSNSVYFVSLKAKGYNKSKRIVLKR